MIDWLGAKIVASGSDTFNAFVNEVVTIAMQSSSTAGVNIQTLSNHPGGGFLERNSTVVREYNGGNLGYWPGTSADMLGGSGANVSTGIYNYQLSNGVIRNAVFTLLHELLHAYDINVLGITPLPGGNEARENEINSQITALMNNPAVKNKFESILQKYPARGLIIAGQGVTE